MRNTACVAVVAVSAVTPDVTYGHGLPVLTASYGQQMETAVVRRVLGMDVSTSVTGITVIDPPLPGDDTPQLVLMMHVELSKFDDFWAKADELRRVMSCLKHDTDKSTVASVTHVFVEESLQAFRPGFSSAATLMTLAKFNGVACMIIRDVLGLTPEPIAATSARKTCGVCVQRGMPAKQQTFDQITGPGGPLAGHVFPTKRQTKKTLGKRPEPVGWAYDEVDSFVIAWAGLRSLL